MTKSLLSSGVDADRFTVILSDSSKTTLSYQRIVIEGRGQVYRFTTSAFDVTIDGHTYMAANNITKMSPIVNTNFIDRELFNIEFMSTDVFAIDDMHRDLIGGRLFVYVDLWDEENSRAVPGYNLYTGFIERTHIKSDSENKKTTVLECVGAISNLNLVKGFVGSKEGQRQVNPNDTSHDNISADREQIIQYWGQF